MKTSLSKKLLTSVSVLALLLGTVPAISNVNVNVHARRRVVRHYRHKRVRRRRGRTRRRNYRRKRAPYRFNKTAFTGRKDGYNFFMDTSDEDSQSHMEHANVNSKQYRAGFISGARKYDVPYRNINNVLSAIKKYQSNHGREFRKGWSNGLYDNNDENLVDSSDATDSQFDEGWYYGDMLNNGGNASHTKQDWSEFIGTDND